MRIRSLRTRLVLFSTLVSGLVIIAVSLLTWSFLIRSARESVDLQLESISGRLIRDLHPRMDRERLVQRIEITHGDEMKEAGLILHLRDHINDSVVYSSLEDRDGFFSQFPEGFPTKPGESRPRADFELNRPPGMSGAVGRDGPGAPGKLSGEGKGKSKGKMPKGMRGPEPPGRPGPPGNEPLAGAGPIDQQYATITAFGKDWRTIINHERGYFVLAAVDLTEAIAELNTLKRGFLIGIPIAIALIGLGGWLVVDRAMKPVREIAEAAAHITALDLSARIEGSRNSDPEFEHLIHVLNGMMERLEAGFSHANRFSTDVSHELNTPLAVMQGEIESALRSCTPGTGEEERLLLLREETDRLKSITRSLMLLSRADVGELIRKRDRIELSTELAGLVEDAEALTEQSGLEIRALISEGVTIAGEVTLMRQAMLNLINNAIKYNREGGFVRISLDRDGSGARIEVENTGPGISGEARSKVFDRFYRADQSRSRQIDGYGLGLSLTQAIVTGHGGSIELADSEDGLTRFVVTLPLLEV